MAKKINVFVVEDHQVVREGIISLLEENPRFYVSGQAANGKEALDKINQLEPKPDLVLSDITMPEMDGIELSERLTRQYEGKIKILALTMVKQALHIHKMIQNGAQGYILKNCDKMELFTAIEIICQGGTYFSQGVSRVVIEDMAQGSRGETTLHPVSLSKRELEVLTMIVSGLRNAEIAEQLHISIRTVETHKQNLIMKTDTTNVAGLVVYAIKHALVDIS